MSIQDILYTAVIGDEHERLVDITRESLDQADIIQVSEDTLHLIHGHQSTIIQLVTADYAVKRFILRINGKDVKVRLRDEVESRVHAMGFDVSRNHVKLKQISSPMPGMVLKVLVREGEEVSEGQPVVILEAMKMENVLNAPARGIISKIHTLEKKKVDKGEVLVELA